MKLLTKELEKKFSEYPLDSQDGKIGDANVIAKFFNPCGSGTWLITEGDIIRDDKGNIEDVTMFGFVNLIGMDCAELGYVTLNELQSIQLPFGLTIERDLHFPEKITLREACEKEFGVVPEILRPEINETCEKEHEESDITKIQSEGSLEYEEIEDDYEMD